MRFFSLKIFLLESLCFSLILSNVLVVEVARAQSFVPPPVFSHESGFYATNFDLLLSHPDQYVTIYYTLDGSDPDPDNLNGSTFRYKNGYGQPPAAEPIGEFLYQEYKTHLYTNSISIVDRTFEPDRISQISTTFDEIPDYFPKPIPGDTWVNNVFRGVNIIIHHINKAINQLIFHYDKYILRIPKQKMKKQFISSVPYSKPLKYLFKGTPVKAMAVTLDNKQSKIVSKVFFIGDPKEFTLPIINLTVPEKDLFDYDEGIFVAGRTYEDWLKEGDVQTIYPHRPGNFSTKKVHTFADLTVSKKEEFVTSPKIEIRVHGFGSRTLPQKSIRIYPAKDSDVSFFDDDLVHEKSSRFILRNAGWQQYQSSRFLDGVMHNSLKGLNFGIQRYKPYLVFINAEYYGILNARDRVDTRYLKNVFKLKDRKIDLIGNWSIVKNGDLNKWNEFLESIQNSDPWKATSYNNYVKYIDPANFNDYFITNIYIANTDWPFSNNCAWRYNGQIDLGHSYEDGKWRWILQDVDQAALDASYNMMIHATLEGGSEWPNPEQSTFLLRTLLKNPRFQEEFVTRFSDLLNSWFIPGRMVAIIRDAEKGLEKEMPKHIARWNAPKSMKYWRESVNKLVEFFEQRPAYQWQHLQDFFHLDSPYNLEVDIHQPGTGKIKVNTLTIGDDPNKNYEVTDTPLFFPWSGQYFKELPLTLEAVPAKGYEFSHWESGGMVLSQEEKQCQTLELKPTCNISMVAVMYKKEQ